MPNAAEILESLATISERWQALAVLWHIYFGLLAAAAIFGWRPPGRLAGTLLIPPIASVSVLAWMQGNPFNGALTGMLCVALVLLLRRTNIAHVMLASPPSSYSGRLCSDSAGRIRIFSKETQVLLICMPRHLV